MNLNHVSIGRDPPEEVNAIIEVPIDGEPIKYEMDKKAGMLVVDRFLYTAMRYPGNYGFIPHTLSEDGDPCDVLVANARPIIPGAIIAVRPIDVLKMPDEAGGDDRLRVGIHVSDVIVEPDGDLLGDGVNIAARLQEIADPGTVCLSEDAFHQVRNKVSVPIVDKGKCRAEKYPAAGPCLRAAGGRRRR